MSEEELKRFKEEQKYQNELFNDFALDSWCEESETINRAISRLTKEHFALLEKEKRIDKAIEYIKENTLIDYYGMPCFNNQKNVEELLEILGDKGFNNQKNVEELLEILGDKENE